MLKLPQMRLRAGTATGGAAMSNSVRNYVWLVVGALVCIAGVLVFHFAPKALRWGRAGVIVRRPNPKPLTKASDRQLRNIAPLATVTVSSADTARGQTGEGVADGQPDARGWARPRGKRAPRHPDLRRWQCNRGARLARRRRPGARYLCAENHSLRHLPHRSGPGPQCRPGRNHGHGHAELTSASTSRISAWVRAAGCSITAGSPSPAGVARAEPPKPRRRGTVERHCAPLAASSRAPA